MLRTIPGNGDENDQVKGEPSFSQLTTDMEGNHLRPPGYVEDYPGPINCRRCDSSLGRIIYGPPTGVHYGKIVCRDCGHFWNWAPKPKKKKPSRKGNADLLKLHSRDFCECCLRTRANIPLPQTLEVHHIIPVEIGGGDEASNLQIVCTSCHKLIHHQRTYLLHGNSSIDELIERLGLVVPGDTEVGA